MSRQDYNNLRLKWFKTYEKVFKMNFEELFKFKAYGVNNIAVEIKAPKGIWSKENKRNSIATDNPKELDNWLLKLENKTTHVSVYKGGF